MPVFKNRILNPMFDTSLQTSQILKTIAQSNVEMQILMDPRLTKLEIEEKKILPVIGSQSKRALELARKPIIDKFRSNTYSGGRPPSLHVDDFVKTKT
eukprot:UN20326